MLKYGVFFKLNAFKNGFNLKVLFLHPMAGSKMVHGGDRFFWSMEGVDPQPPICPCMFRNPKAIVGFQFDARVFKYKSDQTQKGNHYKKKFRK